MTNVMLIVLSVGSFLGGIDPAWIALVGTLFGGAGLKLVEWYLSKNQAKADANHNLAKDYRAEVMELRERLRYEEVREDHWRDKYYTLRESMLEASDAYTKAGEKPPDVVE